MPEPMHGHLHEAIVAAPFWFILLATVVLALVAAPTGSVLLWRRFAYFGDALGHAAMLGVALMLAMHLPVFAGVALVALAVAAVVILMARRGQLAHDALLGTFAHGLLALGLLLAYLLLGPGVELHDVLFGDVLHMTVPGGIAVMAGALLIGLFLWRHWAVLVLGAVSDELALAEGWPVNRAQMLLVLATAVLLALAAKATGLLLFSSLLVIPAAAARALARTPEQMAALAALLAVVAVIGGLFTARAFAIPSGPAIVSIAFGFFAIFHLAAWLRQA